MGTHPVQVDYRKWVAKRMLVLTIHSNRPNASISIAIAEEVDDVTGDDLPARGTDRTDIASRPH